MREVYRSQKSHSYDENNNTDDLEMEDNEDNMQSESSSSSYTGMSSNLHKPYLARPNKILIQGWMKIKSTAFGNNRLFPELQTPDGDHKVIHTKDFERVNPTYVKGGPAPSNLHFFFRLTPAFLYYSYQEKDINVAGALNLKNVADLKWLSGKETCMVVTDGDNNVWTVCQKDKILMQKWFCHTLKLTGLQKEEGKCDPKNYTALSPNVVIKTITQPLIIIPLPSKHCNSNWDYGKRGSDWECQCKEGKEQSPIDLPPPDKAIDTDVKPLFTYDFVDTVMTEDYGPGRLKTGEKNVIRYDNGALRIKHPNFGKIVTLDGAVYIAQEIVFHTPSEHQIEGNTYDMEMQIIHYGKSVGDTVKQVILSFMFKAKPGVFNKFIDKLDFFDLPNPHDKFRELSNTLFIPHILLESDEEDLSIMNPFSFYTYQGSLTAPPCNEQTIHYVASKPINLSNTALELFKEALRVPDRVDAKGNIVTSNSLMENNRQIQPLNGRSVFHYDHSKYNCPDFRRKATPADKGVNGHYEKRTRETVEYVFVNGNKPSGMPGSFVVSEKEAKGTGI